MSTQTQSSPVRSAARPRGTPTLRVERALLREGRTWLAAMDEVGRGALAGPVSVGVVLVGLDLGTVPQGVRDSKLLPPAARERLVPRIKRWAPAYGVGHSGPDEVDRVGIMAALRAAGRRALAQLPVTPDLVLLDGNHDWLTDPRGEGLFALLDDAPVCPPVHTLIKADLKCSSVAAASVLAKVERDAMMTALSPDYPEYAWHENKGYSAPEHMEALRRVGPSPLHRQTWRLPLQQAGLLGDEDALLGAADVGLGEQDALVGVAMGDDALPPAAAREDGRL